MAVILVIILVWKLSLIIGGKSL